MKSHAIALALAAAALSFGSPASARDDGRDYRDWRQAQHRQFQENWFYQQQLQNQREQFAHRIYEQRRRHEPRYAQPQYDGGAYSSGYAGQWGARAPHYRRGEYLPRHFRQRQYYVDDWDSRRLYAPPQGYQWVQADDSGDYLLVAVATGLIANLILNQ